MAAAPTVKDVSVLKIIEGLISWGTNHEVLALFEVPSLQQIHMVLEVGGLAGGLLVVFGFKIGS